MIVASDRFLRRCNRAERILRAANVRPLSGGEAPSACGSSGAPLAATKEIVGGRDLQAA